MSIHWYDGFLAAIENERTGSLYTYHLTISPYPQWKIVPYMNCTQIHVLNQASNPMVPDCRRQGRAKTGRGGGDRCNRIKIYISCDAFHLSLSSPRSTETTQHQCLHHHHLLDSESQHHAKTAAAVIRHQIDSVRQSHTSDPPRLGAEPWCDPTIFRPNMY